MLVLGLGFGLDVDVPCGVENGEYGFGELHFDEDVPAVGFEWLGFEGDGLLRLFVGAEYVGLVGLQPVDEGDVKVGRVLGEFFYEDEEFIRENLVED